MKNILLTGAVLLSMQILAQSELSLNVGNLLFKEFALSYEQGITDNLSISGFASYNYDLPPSDNIDFINRNINFGPELKYYVNPNKGIDGFFVGLYVKESIGTITVNNNYSELLANSSQAVSDFNRMAVGFQIGGKWVVQNNVLFGLNFGMGRNLYNAFSDQVVRDYYFNDNSLAENFDFKFGFSMGYRFGNVSK